MIDYLWDNANTCASQIVQADTTIKTNFLFYFQRYVS